MLDGVRGGNQGVMVVRDGTPRGGDSFFYAYGTYTCAAPKAMASRSPANRAFDSNRTCGYWFRIERGGRARFTSHLRWGI
jgi:hypothetical protein